MEIVPIGGRTENIEKLFNVAPAIHSRTLCRALVFIFYSSFLFLYRNNVIETYSGVLLSP